MENNKYTGFFLLQEIEGVNLFLSVVEGDWFDSLSFNPFENCTFKKNVKNYYIVGHFANEKDFSCWCSHNIQVIKDLGPIDKFLIKHFYVASSEWLKEKCNFENFRIRLVMDYLIENKHIYFHGSNLMLKTDLEYEPDKLAQMFYFKKSEAYLCDNDGKMVSPKDYYPPCLKANF